MKKSFLTILLLVSSPFVLLAQNEYAGSQRCAACHQEAFEIWSKSMHAKAHASLPADKKKELRCLFCHATDAKDDLQKYRLVDVHCEACHGPGAQHIAIAADVQARQQKKPSGLRPVTEETCKECHTDVRSPTLRAFDFRGALQAIRHWKLEETTP